MSERAIVEYVSLFIVSTTFWLIMNLYFEGRKMRTIRREDCPVKLVRKKARTFALYRHVGEWWRVSTNSPDLPIEGAMARRPSQKITVREMQDTEMVVTQEDLQAMCLAFHGRDTMSWQDMSDFLTGRQV